MGEVADKYSDIVILTADNPRREDPRQIISDIEGGIKNSIIHHVVDRGEAIEFAIKEAVSGDIILILGKGHEMTQTLKEKTIHFNDVEAVENVLGN